MAEVVEWLSRSDADEHVVVRAAMAHLHTVSVHPFRDGNGRISRIVQSLVLARDGLLSHEFASIEQARRRRRQIVEAGTRWSLLESIVESRGWPNRLVIALEQSLIGGTDRSSYEHEADISSATASNDFRRLLDAGLVVQHGRGRAVRYRASDELRSSVTDAIAARADD